TSRFLATLRKNTATRNPASEARIISFFFIIYASSYHRNWGIKTKERDKVSFLEKIGAGAPE
ncbi:MAG: hypothetical protein Q7R48_01145, partial [bacterium]|nr:hypothetical protein [bacterium]